MTTYKFDPAKLDKFDAFQTPQQLASMCALYLHDVLPEMPDLFIEPSAGSGAFVHAIKRAWGPSSRVLAVEIDKTHEEKLVESGADEIEWSSWENFSRGLPERTMIIGNPPYRWSTRHIELALARLGDTVATEPMERYLGMILNGQFFLGGLDRYRRVLARGSLRWVWGIVGRPQYWGHGAQRFGGSSENAFLVWQAGYRGPYEGRWLEWK